MSPLLKTNDIAGPLALLASFQIDAAAPTADSTMVAALPRFRMVAYTGGPMRVSGWKFPVIVDLAGLAIPSQNRPIRFGHDASAGAGVGHTDVISVEAGQLIAAGVVSRDTPAAKEIVISSKNGFPWQASIGASVEEFEFIKDGLKAIVNGRTFEGPVNVVRKATLGEISFVDLGADGNTSAQVAASQIDMTHEKETATMDGMITNSSTGTSSTSAGTATGAGSAGTAVTAPPVQAAAVPTVNATDARTVDQIRADALAETTRIAGIRRICNGKCADIEAQAIRDGWDQTKTELEVLRASRPKAPVANGNVMGAPMGFSFASPGPATPAMLEAACLLSAGLNKPENHCSKQDLDAASKRFRNGISLQDLMVEAAMVNGYVGRTFRSDPHTIMAMAFPSKAQLEAGLATIDIAPILSNVGNKFLLDGFFSVERTWRNICAVRSVTDFKTVTSYRLIGADQYELIAPGGELKHGTLGNETYSNKADTYGLMLSIDRRDVINDDLGAITTVPRKLGRGSGLKINDVFWAIFLNNVAIFTAAAKNYLTGANTALGIDSLSNTVQAFNDQVDSDGTGGGTQHVTQSLGTVQRYPENAPDMGGAIGVTHDSVEGVDITIPIYQFSETHYLSPSTVTDAYKRQLFILTGKVNSTAFRGFQPGECLFLGAAGSRRGKSADDDWEITFKFAGSLNASNLTVGSITGINKKGWEYMWVRYQDAEDSASNTLIKKPVAVYIEKVYDEANFAALAIG